MAVMESHIVPASQSEIHDEPHIEGSRVTVRFINARVNGRDLQPETVADRHNLDVSDVYEALAYYHRNLEEMQEIEDRRRERSEVIRRESDLTPPE